MEKNTCNTVRCHCYSQQSSFVFDENVGGEREEWQKRYEDLSLSCHSEFDLFYTSLSSVLLREETHLFRMTMIKEQEWNSFSSSSFEDRNAGHCGYSSRSCQWTHRVIRKWNPGFHGLPCQRLVRIAAPKYKIASLWIFLQTSTSFFLCSQWSHQSWSISRYTYLLLWHVCQFDCFQYHCFFTLAVPTNCNDNCMAMFCSTHLSSSLI